MPKPVDRTIKVHIKQAKQGGFANRDSLAEEEKGGMSENKKAEVNTAAAAAKAKALEADNIKKKLRHSVSSVASSAVSDFGDDDSVDSGNAVNGACPYKGACTTKPDDDLPPIMNLVLDGEDKNDDEDDKDEDDL